MAGAQKVKCKIPVLVFNLPHSDDCFVTTCPAEIIEAFCGGYAGAFAFSGRTAYRVSASRQIPLLIMCSVAVRCQTHLKENYGRLCYLSAFCCIAECFLKRGSAFSGA